MSFQQALPRLAQMSEDAEFVDAVNKVGLFYIVEIGYVCFFGVSCIDEGRTE